MWNYISASEIMDQLTKSIVRLKAKQKRQQSKQASI